MKRWVGVVAMRITGKGSEGQKKGALRDAPGTENFVKIRS